MIELDDIIAVLEELRHSKEQLALNPQDVPNKQYLNLGVAIGVKNAIQKLQNHYGREVY